MTRPSRLPGRPWCAAIAIGITLTACAANDEAVTDDGGPAFVTTTAPAVTTDPPTESTPAAGTEAPTEPTSGDTPASSVPQPTATTTTPTSAPAAMGNPVIALDPLGQFDRPVGLAARPNDEAVWIVEQRGQIVRAEGDERVVALEISEQLSTGTEQGLLGLTFSPDALFAYTYSTDTSGNSLVSEYPVDANGIFDTGARRTVLTIEQPFANHNGGEVLFGPDGYLYISVGDGGSANDPNRNASDPTSWLGTILRIDPTPTDDAAYTIPPDNPFATGTLNGIDGAPEVWSWGLRNPWRLAFDPATDDLWIADVGQNQYEEINRVSPSGDQAAGFAANFGWSAFEGITPVNADVEDRGNLVSPVLVYPHGENGCSVSGGAVYRGDQIPELVSGYLYGDYCSGRLWVVDVASERNLLLLEGLDQPAAIREGPNGELFVLELGGTVSRIVAG